MMPGRNHYRAALMWQFALAAYMQLISWVPLGRWNYQPCCPPALVQLRRGTLTLADSLAAAAFLLPAAVFWLGVRTQRRWAMWCGLLATTVWLGLQLATWWPPYLFGASDRWAQVYARAFSHSTQILPRWGTHLPPDGMHLPLQTLLAGAVASGARALLRRPRSNAEPFGG